MSLHHRRPQQVEPWPGWGIQAVLQIIKTISVKWLAWNFVLSVHLHNIFLGYVHINFLIKWKSWQIHTHALIFATKCHYDECMECIKWCPGGSLRSREAVVCWQPVNFTITAHMTSVLSPLGKWFHTEYLYNQTGHQWIESEEIEGLLLILPEE